MSRDVRAATRTKGLHRVLADNLGLAFVLTKREVVGRYRGSFMGLLWSFLHPLLMLAVYTFVFSVVFQARWPSGQGSRIEFALVLFTGLMVFSVFSECVNRAPGLILGNVNYVKKVVFPLEILPLVSMMSALFHLGVTMLVWVGFHLLYFGLPPLTAFLFPLVLLPLILLTLGVSWLLASLGVYLRDVGQVVGVGTTVLLFMSPIFYSIESLPEAYRPLLRANPLTIVIEQARDVLIWERGINWGEWMAVLVLSAAIAYLGYTWFQATRKGFADVL